jgi:hypothetical protein
MKGFLLFSGGGGGTACALQSRGFRARPHDGPAPLTKEITMFDEIFALTEDQECSLCCDQAIGGNRQAN